MSIPEHFEFHYVENGVKKSVTLFPALLFNKTPAPGASPPARKPAPTSQQRAG
jgi:hypothetical protein